MPRRTAKKTKRRSKTKTPEKEKRAKDPLTEAWLGGTPIKDLVAEFGKTRSQIRRHLTEAVGGREKFRALRAQGAGGQTELFGGKRAASGSSLPDDAKVKRIYGTPLKKEGRPRGWKVEWHAPFTRTERGDLRDALDKRDVYISPTGERYVEAGSTERADLIVDHNKKVPGLGITRLRLESTSGAAKRARRKDKELRAREHAAIERRAKKRARRRPRSRATKTIARKKAR